MPDFYDIRCHLPATYRPGECGHLLFRFSSTGGVELKCSTCKRVVMIHKSERLEPIMEGYG